MNKQEKREYSRLWYIKHKDRILIGRQKYLAENRDKILERSRAYNNSKEVIERRKIYNQLRRKEKREYDLKSKYGITADEYNKMLVEQNGCCKICGVHEQKLKKILYVDHCHKTMKVRGLLCTKCNSLLALCNDNIEVLNKSIYYLKSYHEL